MRSASFFQNPENPSDPRDGRRGPGRPSGRGHRGHHDAFGPGGFGPGFGPGGFGPGGPGFGGPGGHRGHGRGRRAGRGDVRAAVLLLLAEEPMHGYQLIQRIGEKSGGVWRPSPGAIYPALNLLQDEGLVQLSDDGGRRLASLTDAGRAYVAEHADELGEPWSDASTGGRRAGFELREAGGALAQAIAQVARTGDAAQVAATVDVLARARREVYLILAGEAPAPSDAASDGPDDGDVSEG
ncbi:PadR family transcriptional regulator [Luteimicrobium sp. DT211]|uniref:PadR family transcriptional regulator n=1 Tax=Luteimicrobium sp. DT211 TaxID=3393412 RepID=UPI003CF79F2F